MVEIFQNNNQSTYWAEAAELAAVVEEREFKLLISAFSNAIIKYKSDNNILDPDLLISFSHVLLRKGIISAHNASLGTLLDSPSTRLKEALKSAEVEKQYHLICILGTILDVMVDIHITGLDREGLHKPLHDLLYSLRDHEEPRLAHAARYAYEALRGVPDNEGPWEAAGRNLWTIISISATVAGGVAELNPQRFVDVGPGAIEVLKAFKALVTSCREAYDQSDELKDAFKQITGFLKKPVMWYGALRYSRLLIETGALGALRKFISELPAGKGELWCGLYVQLEQSWMAFAGLRPAIKNFIEWMHGEERFQKSAKEYPEIGM